MKYHIFTATAMSISDVTRRFLLCLDKLVACGTVRSRRQFAIATGYHAQGLSEMAAERRDAPLELIEKAVKIFRFNPVYLFSGNGSLFLQETAEEGLQLRHLTILTDQHGDERIVHVPCPAQAGYGKSLCDPVYIQKLPSFQLPDPQFKSGTYRSFEIAGTSMEPTFKSGDLAIAAYIEAKYWEQAVKSNQIFIIVTAEEVLIKRILNKIKSDRIIECISDNEEFDSYTIPVTDILEIWKVRMKLTAHFAPPDSLNSTSITRQLRMQQKMLENLQDHFTKSPVA
ncbi:MAG TPA: S24 family peptidase [Saprospiraceae bacterium]|nr:S24 family peptidase [Saprospiraceae bacterium]